MANIKPQYSEEYYRECGSKLENLRGIIKPEQDLADAMEIF